MKIAIISDIHDNLANLEKCLGWCKNNTVEVLICCGDVTDGETLRELAKKFIGSIFLVRGNMDIFEPQLLKKFPNIDYLGKYGTRMIASHSVGICHEPEYIDSILAEKEAQIIFYGHTHKPWIEARNGVKIVNPGTIAGTFSKPAFAFWDTVMGKLELIILELL